MVWIVLHEGSDICLSCVEHMEHHGEGGNKMGLTGIRQVGHGLRGSL